MCLFICQAITIFGHFASEKAHEQRETLGSWLNC